MWVKKFLMGGMMLFFSVTVFAQTNNEQLAYQYFRDQEFEKARELFSELYKQNPSNHYYSFYFQTLLQTGDSKEAEKLVKKQIKQYPEVQKYYVDLGYVYETEGESTKAKKQFENCIDAIVSPTVLVVELARAFQAYRQNDYALKTYFHGRKLSNQATAYSTEIAGLYEELGNYEKAMEEYMLLLGANETMLAFIESRLTNWLLDDIENSRSEIIRLQTLKSSNKHPDNIAYASLMIWFSMQKKDFPAALKQAKAMDKRYNETGQRIFDLASIAVENQDFTTAVDAYNYLVARGTTTLFYHDAQTMLLYVRLMQVTMTYKPTRQEALGIDKDLSTHFQEKPVQATNFDLYRRWISLKAVQLQDIATATEMITTNLASNTIGQREKALLKLDLGDILQLEGDVWEATLLYSQVEKDFPNDTIGHLAKYKNAKLSFHIGEFEWAKAQLDVLRAATSKLIANDAMYFSLLISDNQHEDDSVNIPLKQFAAADFLIDIHHYEEALQLFDSIEQQNLYHSLLDDILYKKAQIAMLEHKYQKADSLYEALITSYSHDLLADEALFERAKLQEIHLKDNLKAMELYQQLLLHYSDSIYTVEARKRFRALRGDVLKTGD
jgi:tetratricopeptide (TPR) repeat protein